LPTAVGPAITIHVFWEAAVGIGLKSGVYNFYNASLAIKPDWLIN